MKTILKKYVTFISQKHINQIANHLISEYGDEALLYAMKKEAHSSVKSSFTKTKIWHKIANAIENTQLTKIPKHDQI